MTVFAMAGAVSGRISGWATAWGRDGGRGGGGTGGDREAARLCGCGEAPGRKLLPKAERFATESSAAAAEHVGARVPRERSGAPRHPHPAWVSRAEKQGGEWVSECAGQQHARLSAHPADARGSRDMVDTFRRVHAWQPPASPSPRTTHQWQLPLFLATHPHPEQVAQAARDADILRDADVLVKLHALQAGAGALQADRDALRSQIEACDRDRIARANESREILMAVSGRAEEMLGALSSLDDRERDRAALASVLSENGLRDKSQRLQGAIKMVHAERDMLEERLALADKHAAEIEAEARRCKARLMTTKKEKANLVADNTVLERRAKNAGLALADERQRHARLLEEIRLLTCAVEETHRVEEHERRKIDGVRLRLQLGHSRQADIELEGGGDVDSAGCAGGGGGVKATRGGWGSDGSRSLFLNSHLLGEDTFHVDIGCAGLQGQS